MENDQIEGERKHQKKKFQVQQFHTGKKREVEGMGEDGDHDSDADHMNWLRKSTRIVVADQKSGQEGI